MEEPTNEELTTLESEPAIILTVGEALDAHEMLEYLAQDLLMMKDEVGPVLNLAVRALRDRIFEVMSAMEHQLEAAEAL